MKPCSIRILFYITLALLVGYCESALGQDDDEISMKAVFLERFTRYIEWPDDSLDLASDSIFHILILGQNPFGKTLETLLSTTKIKRKKTHFVYSNDIKDIAQCHMVYISSSMKKKINVICSTVRQHPVLSIGDTKGYAKQGVMINFIIEEEMLRFEINLKEFRNSLLICSSALLKIAKIVDN